MNDEKKTWTQQLKEKLQQRENKDRREDSAGFTGFSPPVPASLDTANLHLAYIEASLTSLTDDRPQEPPTSQSEAVHKQPTVSCPTLKSYVISDCKPIINKMSEKGQIPDFLIKAIPIFDGKANALCDFLEVVTEIESTYVTKNLNENSKRENKWVLYHLVKSKLVGTARDLISTHQCTNLTEVLGILRDNFSDRKPIVTLISELWNIRSGTGQHPLEFLDYVVSRRNIIITKYKLEKTDEVALKTLIDQLEKQVVLIFLKNIPEQLAMQLECMKVQTLEECRRHLTQTCTIGLENSIKNKPRVHVNYNSSSKYNVRSNVNNATVNPGSSWNQGAKSRFDNDNTDRPSNDYQKKPFSKPNEYRNRFDGKNSEYPRTKQTTFKTEPRNINSGNYSKPYNVKKEPGQEQPLHISENAESVLAETLSQLNVRLDKLENHFLGEGPHQGTDTS
jgi:hypothetical protein